MQNGLQVRISSIGDTIVHVEVAEEHGTSRSPETNPTT
jgi:hypothetical protein